MLTRPLSLANCALGIMASLVFYYGHNIPDKATYIDLARHVYFFGVTSQLFSFNYLEVLSLIIFWFVGFLDALGIEAALVLALLIFLCTVVVFESLPRRSKFLFVSYLILIFAIYLHDFWTNQLRAMVGLTVFLFFIQVTKSRQLKSADYGKLAIPALLHVQCALIMPAVIFRTKAFGLVIIFLSGLCTLGIPTLFEYLAALDEAFTLTKFAQYSLIDPHAKPNFYQALRITLIAFLSLISIHVYSRGNIIFHNLACTNLAVVILFIEMPSVYGRLTSMLVFFEPMLIYYIQSKIIKYWYLAVLVANASLKAF